METSIEVGLIVLMAFLVALNSRQASNGQHIAKAFGKQSLLPTDTLFMWSALAGIYFGADFIDCPDPQ